MTIKNKKNERSIELFFEHLKHTFTSRMERRNLRNGLLFIFPWLIGLFLLTIYPVFASLYWSFCMFDGFSAPIWTGLENFNILFQEDPLFWKSLTNTLFMVIAGLPITLLISLILAVLLDMKLKGQAIYRTILYLPSIAPLIAVSVLWLWMLNPEFGIINKLLGFIGIDAVGWFINPKLSKPALIIMGLWQIGGGVIIFLAGLQNVPTQLYEAADVDGANVFQKFIHVTLPMISPIIFFNVIMGIIGYFQYFTQAFAMTQGGPQNSTLFYALHLFNRAFLDFQIGYASAMAWILFVITLIATLIVMKTSKTWVYYEEEMK